MEWFRGAKSFLAAVFCPVGREWGLVRVEH